MVEFVLKPIRFSLDGLVGAPTSSPILAFVSTFSRALSIVRILLATTQECKVPYC